MNTVCMYFEVHQPHRLRPYGFFDIGANPYYVDEEKNRAIMRKVADKCYMPATELLLELCERHGEEFRCTFSISGTALEQMKQWRPDVLDNFKRLADTGNVEFLSETYYHSLAALFSEKEFRAQVEEHTALMERELGVRPRAFRNTELIFSNHVAWLAQELGYQTILMEGVERVLDWRSPNFVYRHAMNPDLKILLKNYKLSDDIAFRFSDRNWSEFPLHAEKFASWVHAHEGEGEVFNLFMDFETFGEHQWEDSGIFDFLRSMPEMILRHPEFRFLTVSETAEAHQPVGEIESHEPVSWADTERDISAWLGNSLQQQAVRSLYELENDIHTRGREKDLQVFRRLQTSDHFYYMCTKYFNDGDVHKYFSPYESPYDAYVYFMNILQDFRQRLPATQEEATPPLPGSSVESRNADLNASILQ